MTDDLHSRSTPDSHERPAEKHLLFLVTELYYFESHKKDLALIAADAGFNVSVAARCDDGSNANSNFNVIDLQWHRSGSLIGSALNFLPELWRVRRLIREVNPHVLHNIALKSAILGSLGALGTRTQVINSINGLGFVFHSASLLAAVARKLCGFALRLATRSNNARIIFQNRDDLSYARTKMGIPNTHLRLIAGSGVDTNIFNATSEPDRHPFKFLILARLLYMKGIQTAIAAHAILRDRGFDQELTICGQTDSGNPSSIPVHVISQWSKMPGVMFEGQIDDVPARIAKNNAVIHPALGGEGLPKALLEAASSGRALIASDVSGNREVVIPKETGLLVPPDDATALADAMQYVMEHPDERTRWAKKARAKVEAEFSLSLVLDRHKTLYREFLRSST